MVIDHAAEDNECDDDTQECGEKSKPHQPWIRSSCKNGTKTKIIKIAGIQKLRTTPPLFRAYEQVFEPKIFAFKNITNHDHKKFD